jgi:uncharacterized protein (TIGR03437 family)
MRYPALIMVALALLAAAFSSSPSAAQTTDDFFNDNVIQEIRLTMSATDWAKLKRDYLLNTYYPCDMAWRYQGKDVISEDIGIRSRGSGSRSDIKPGLRIDFNRYEEGQTFLTTLKSVVLRNQTQDASQLHERLSAIVYEAMGLPAPREAHVKFYVNGTYEGLYTIVESVDKAFLKRVFNEDDGYLYEWKWVDRGGGKGYFFEYLGSDPNLYSADGRFWQPETHEKDPDPRPLEAMVRAINQSSDADFQRSVSQYLDLNMVMTQLAVEDCIGETDGILGDYGMNNFYFYRFVGKTLSQFLFWDKSETMTVLGIPTWHHHDTNNLTKRTSQVPELRRRYLSELARCAAVLGGTGGWLDKEAAYQYNQIRADALADPNKECKGPDGMPKPCSNAEFEQGVVEVRQFTANRGQRIKDLLAQSGYELRAVNAASYVAGDLAPGSLISIFAAGLANSTASATSFPLPTELAGVSIKINNVAAPLLYVSPTQVNLQVPVELPAGSATITATLNNGVTNTISGNIGAVSPGIFVPVHTDGKTPITPSNPAQANEVLVVYATGLGAVNGTMSSGQPAAALTTRETPVVTVGGSAARVEWSGLTPNFAGLYQVNVKLPAKVPSSDRTRIMLKIGGQFAVPAYVSTR